MSWCDKLASTPTVGLRFSPHFQSSDTILNALSPLLDTWVDGRKQRFTIEKQESFSVQLVNEEGFHYTINHEGVVVDYRHRWKLKAHSGQPPTADLITPPRPFTELLTLVCEKAVDVAVLINGSKTVPFDRIGVVSSTTVSAEDAPPGVKRFVSFVQRPWRTELDFFDIQLSAIIEKTDEFQDRCIHFIAKAEENPDNLMTIRLDWQRIFRPGKTVVSEALKKYLISATSSALKYYEDVAEGGRFDEQIIADAT